jgi:hypothetical protein
LARRCVQGAIRDFCCIAKRTLNDEINELTERLEQGTLGAAALYLSHDLLDVINGVRKIGNIGAHMDKNLDKVIPVDPDEAKLLLELVGTLFSEWYQARSDREERLKRLAKVVTEKDEAKAVAPAGSTGGAAK